MRIRFLPASIAAGAVISGLACAPDLHDKPGALRAGAGRAIIQLPVGIPTAGYAQSRPSDDPMYATPFTTAGDE